MNNTEKNILKEIEKQIIELREKYGDTPDIKDMSSQFCGFKEGYQLAQKENQDKCCAEGCKEEAKNHFSIGQDKGCFALCYKHFGELLDFHILLKDSEKQETAEKVKKLKEEIEYKKQYDGEVMIITLRQLEIIINRIFKEKTE